MNKKKIIISRTDSIGDVVLTLPLAGYLKKKIPDVIIVFLARSYTQPIVESCKYIDSFLNYDELQTMEREARVEALKQIKADVIVHVFPVKDIAHLARKAEIPCRIGTSHRFYHWISCTHQVSFSRKKSDLHEAQLNFKLLSPLGLNSLPTKEELIPLFGFFPIAKIPSSIHLDTQKKRIILHPKSQGSAVEWGIENFEKLAHFLLEKGFQVFITGTANEKESIASSKLFYLSGINDVMGKISLPQLIALINQCDVLVAASTGPLHITAVMGRRAIGIYSEKRPIHPGRWAPIGIDVCVLSKYDKKLSNDEQDTLVKEITPEEVFAKIIE